MIFALESPGCATLSTVPIVDPCCGQVEKDGAEPRTQDAILPKRTTMPHRATRALRIPQITFAPSRPLTSLNPIPPKNLTQFPKPTPRLRYFHTSPRPQQSSPSPPTTPTRTPSAHTNFYRTHGRALFKALTLAFFTYQVCYWAWLVLETEDIKDQKSREVTRLEGEVRLLDEGRKRSSPAGEAGAEKG